MSARLHRKTSVATMPTLSSLQAPHVGVVTTCGAAKVVRGVQWKRSFLTESVSCKQSLPTWLALSQRSRVRHVCVSKLGHHWLKILLLACPRTSHYLDQCWLVINWTLGITLIWTKMQQFPCTKLSLKMSSVRWRPFCLGVNLLGFQLSIWVMILTRSQTISVKKQNIFVTFRKCEAYLCYENIYRRLYYIIYVHLALRKTELCFRV